MAAQSPTQSLSEETIGRRLSMPGLRMLRERWGALRRAAWDQGYEPLLKGVGWGGFGPGFDPSLCPLAEAAAVVDGAVTSLAAARDADCARALSRRSAAHEAFLRKEDEARGIALDGMVVSVPPGGTAVHVGAHFGGEASQYERAGMRCVGVGVGVGVGGGRGS